MFSLHENNLLTVLSTIIKCLHVVVVDRGVLVGVEDEVLDGEVAISERDLKIDVDNTLITV